MLTLVLITAIIAGGLGALTTFLLVQPNTGEGDVAVTCETVNRINFPVKLDEVRLDTPLIHQLSGLSGFAAAAAAGDAPEFREPGNDLLGGLGRADIEKVNEALLRISTVCRELGY